MTTTIRNGDAQARLRARFRDEPEGVATHDDKVASYSAKEYAMEIAPDGTFHIYRRQPGSAHGGTTLDERISLGVEDPRASTSRLLEMSKRLARMNTDNAEFWKRREGIPGQ